MKTIMSLLLTAVFAFGAVSAQAGQHNQSPVMNKTVAMNGDGIDNRHCAELKKQGKKPADMCF